MKKIICIVTAWLLLGSHSSVESSDKIEEAEACFENYVQALKSGDPEKAKQYWNRNEKERYEIYDWQKQRKKKNT